MTTATHSYVGSLPCGCGCSMVVDRPEWAKDTAKDVGDMITRGLTVQRFPHAQAVDAFNARCAKYPHEAWQKRIEAARVARLDRDQEGRR